MAKSCPTLPGQGSGEVHTSATYIHWYIALAGIREATLSSRMASLASLETLLFRLARVHVLFYKVELRSQVIHSGSARIDLALPSSHTVLPQKPQLAWNRNQSTRAVSQ